MSHGHHHSPSPPPPAPPPVVTPPSGATLHYSANGNFANGDFNAAGDPGSVGFNMADVSSQSVADSLPSGVVGLMWTGGPTGDTASFESMINATASDPKVWGYYLADDAQPGDAVNLKAEVDYIHQHAPTKMSFVLPENMSGDTSPVAAFGPAAVDMTTSNDLVGVDPYPVRSQYAGGMNLDVINDRVAAWESAGWQDSQMVPLFQAFGNYPGGDWNLPSTTQENEILQRWASLLPSPKFDYAYSWGQQLGDTSLSMSPDLQQVFAAHNAA